jgi:YHS domain-containing protein
VAVAEGTLSEVTCGGRAIVVTLAQKNGTAIATLNTKRKEVHNEYNNSCERSCLRYAVGPATAAGRTEHNGQSYYFCGSKCKEKFDANPERYLEIGKRKPDSVDL